MEYNKFIDHTLLKPDATIEGITKALPRSPSIRFHVRLRESFLCPRGQEAY
jgi:deoxyribose-phosphate aldolase